MERGNSDKELLKALDELKLAEQWVRALTCSNPHTIPNIKYRIFRAAKFTKRGRSILAGVNVSYSASYSDCKDCPLTGNQCFKEINNLCPEVSGLCYFDKELGCLMSKDKKYGFYYDPFHSVIEIIKKN